MKIGSLSNGLEAKRLADSDALEQYWSTVDQVEELVIKYVINNLEGAPAVSRERGKLSACGKEGAAEYRGGVQQRQ